MATALLVDAHNGAPLAPMGRTVLCLKGILSTERRPSVSRVAHMDQLLPPPFAALVTSAEATPACRTGVVK